MIRSSAILAILAGSAAANCPSPHATLDGDPAAVAAVSAELTKLGVTVGPPVATCQVTATVEVDPQGFAVAVKTGAQSEARTVSDPAIAATWIDSWLQDDFGGPRFTTQLASAPIVHADAAVAARVDRPSHGPGIAIDAAFDQAWTFDGARWSGVTAGACAQFGAWCFGARGHYAFSDELYNETAAGRRDLAVLATASYQQEFGRIQLVPELGLGIGRTTTTRISGCRPIPCGAHDPGCGSGAGQPDPMCIATDPEHAYVVKDSDELAGATVAPRASAAIRIAIAIADHWWLDGTAAVTVSPFAHRDPFMPPTGIAEPPGATPAQLALPGESIGTLALGLGLRWGAR